MQFVWGRVELVCLETLVGELDWEVLVVFLRLVLATMRKVVRCAIAYLGHITLLGVRAGGIGGHCPLRNVVSLSLGYCLQAEASHHRLGQHVGDTEERSGEEGELRQDEWEQEQAGAARCSFTVFGGFACVGIRDELRQARPAGSTHANAPASKLVHWLAEPHPGYCRARTKMLRYNIP